MLFSECKNSQDTKELISKIILRKSVKEVQNFMAIKFYNIENIVEFLYNIFALGVNGSLYGPGGFGKSQITKEFLNFFSIPMVTIVGHSSMDIEALIGIPNIKKLTEDSKYEVAFENSVFNNAGVLILEEFYDVKPTTAAGLKDIITESGYRNGINFTPSKTGSILICSNKSPEDVITDVSTAAFYRQRFPYSIYVSWDKYSAKDYLNLFNITNKKIDSYTKKFVAEICSSSCDSEKIVSPRIAIVALNDYFKNKTIRSLKFISELDLSRVETIIYELEKEIQYNKLNPIIFKLITDISNTVFSSKNEIIKFKFLIKNISAIIKKSDIQNENLLNTITTLFDAIAMKIKELDKFEYSLGSAIEELSDITNSYEKIKSILLF